MATTLPPNEFIPSAAIVERPAEAPAACSDQINCIGEIFVGAAKLGYVPDDFDPAAITRTDEILFDVLKAMVDPNARGLDRIPDEEAFMVDIDEPPLFLRQAV